MSERAVWEIWLGEQMYSVIVRLIACKARKWVCKSGRRGYVGSEIGQADKQPFLAGWKDGIAVRFDKVVEMLAWLKGNGYISKFYSVAQFFGVRSFVIAVTVGFDFWRHGLQSQMSVSKYYGRNPQH